MNKKLLKALPVCALLLILLGFLAFFKGADTLTVFQKLHVNSMISSNPFIDEETGEIINPVSFAAANDSTNADTNSFLWFRNIYESGATHVVLDIAFDRSGVAYLASSFDDVTAESVTFERVLGHAAEYGDGEIGFVLNLCEYTSLAGIAANIEQTGLQYNTVITGVNENALSVVTRYFAKTPVLCTYDSETKMTLEELSEAGADGIICKADKLSGALVKKARSLGLLVWVECDDDLYDTIRAFNFCVDGMVFHNRSLKAGSLEIKRAYQYMDCTLKGDEIEVLNRYDFTNLSEYTFRYQIKVDGNIIQEKDLILNVKIDIPKNMSAEDRKTAEELDKSLQKSNSGGGFFGKWFK